MKATVIRHFCGPDMLVHEDVETPTPRLGNRLVQTRAAGVNRFDHYIREGSVTPDLPFPHILGDDAAGEVAEPGGGVSGFEVGERVAPLTRYPTNDIAFTPAVQRARQDRGSRDLYAEVEARAGWRDRVTLDLAAFIAERDSLYLGTANADGQPYIKHRGGR